MPHNHRVNAPGRPVTGLAQNARPAPVHPARYAARYPDRPPLLHRGGDAFHLLDVR